MFLTMGHELGHVQHIVAGLQGSFSAAERHFPIFQWERAAADANGWRKYAENITSHFLPKFSQPESALNILTIPFKLISRK